MSRSGGDTGVVWIFTFSDVILFTLKTEQQKNDKLCFFFFFFKQKDYFNKKCGDSAASHVATLNTRLFCRGAVEQNRFFAAVNSERLVLSLCVLHLFRTIATTREVCRRIGSGDCLVGHAQSLIQTIWLSGDLRLLLLPPLLLFLYSLLFTSCPHSVFFHFPILSLFISSFQDSPCPPPLPRPGGILHLTAR